MVDRFRNGLAGLVILGASAGLGGCATGATARYNSGLTTYEQYVQEKNAENRYNDVLGFGLLGGLIGARGVQLGKPEAVYLGDALSRHGAAMANSPQVIINNPPPNRPPVYNLTTQIPVVNPVNVTLVEQPRGEPLVIRVEKERLGMVTAVISNYCKDFNGDEKFNYPEDYGGMKRVFLPSEKITLSLASSNSADNLRIELLGADGRKIDSVEGKGFYLCKEYNLRENIFAAGTGGTTSAASSAGGSFAGAFGGTFYVNGKFLGKLEFMVSDKKWEFVQK